MARRIDIRDDEDDVIERDYTTDRNYEVETDTGTNWLPLLIVPLLLGGLLWGLQSYSQNGLDRNNPNGQEFGVGGAPVVTQPVTQPVSPTPMLSPTIMEEDTIMPTNEISPTEMLDEIQ